MSRRSFDPFADRPINRMACAKHLADLRRCGTPLASIGLAEHGHAPIAPPVEWRNACPMGDDKPLLQWNIRRARALRAQNVRA